MENIHIPDDIQVMYVQAESFPEGICDAFDKLHATVTDTDGRTLFGISKPENGVIVYKAATTMLNNEEAAVAGLKTMTIAAGEYVAETVVNVAENAMQVSETFGRLLQHPKLDPASYCVERYEGNDVVCMVKILG